MIWANQIEPDTMKKLLTISKESEFPNSVDLAQNTLLNITNRFHIQNFMKFRFSISGNLVSFFTRFMSFLHFGKCEGYLNFQSYFGSSKFALGLILSLLISTTSWGQINLAGGGTYTQNFNSVTTGATTLPTGWKLATDNVVSGERIVQTSYTSAGTTAGGNTMSLTSCSGITGGGYSLRNTISSGTGGTDYSVGFVGSGSIKNGNLYLAITNNGSSAINSFTISYSTKKYRNGSNAAGFTVQMLTATSASAVTSGWTALGSSFNTVFTSDGNNNCPNNTTPGNGGNIPNATNSVTSQTYTLGTPLAVSSTVYFVWNYAVTSGSTSTNAQQLGIDDVTIVANSAASFHTITFTGSASDFDAGEKFTAAANNTDYYMTFDENYLYLGAFRTSGTFGSNDNFAVYIDTDPRNTPASGNGTTGGRNFNGVTPTLPFNADYTSYTEQSYTDPLNRYNGSWASTGVTPTVNTSTTAREVRIALKDLGGPASVYVTMWMGYSGGIYSNAPGTNLAASATPTIAGFFGSFPIYKAGINPVTFRSQNTSSANGGGTAISNLSLAASGNIADDYGDITISSAAVGTVSVANASFTGTLTMTGTSTVALGTNNLTVGGRGIGGSAGRITMNNTAATPINGTTTAGKVSFLGAGLIDGSNTTRTFGTNSSVIIAGGVDFTGSATNVNGNLQINAGGFVNTNAPTYGSSSTLIYNIGASYGRGTEWSATSGAGYPNNVTLSLSGTSLDIGANGGSGTARQMAGNLMINDGTTFTMATTAMTQPVTVNGNVTIGGGASGSLILSSSVGGDLNVRGNWIKNSGSTFTPNSRAVQFNSTSAAQTLTGATTFDYLTVNNTHSTPTVTLQASSAVTVNTNVTFTAGRIVLGANNLTLGGSSTVTTPTTSKYFVTNSTGVLIRPVSTSAVSFDVGNSSYNPLTLTPGTGSSVPYQVRVIDAVTSPSPNDGTKLINRYWSVTAPTAPANTLALQGQWNTGEANANYAAGSQVKVAYHNGTAWTETNSTQVGANPFTSSGSFAISAGNINSGITFGIGKDDGFNVIVTTYTWDGSSNGDWGTAANWDLNAVPSSATDLIIIPDVGSYGAPLNITGSRTVSGFTVNANGTYAMAAGSSLTVSGTFVNSSSTAPSFDCSSSLILSTSGALTVPAANYGNLNLAGGTRTLSSGATYRICGDYVPAATMTVTGSTVEFNGTTAQAINTNTGLFATVNVTNTTADVTANASVTATAAMSISASAVFAQASGTLTLTGATVTVNGTLRNSTTNNIVGGTITVSGNGTYEHNRNAGIVPTATWQTGSTCLITGQTNTTAPTGLGQSFSDFTWACPGMVSMNLSGGLTTVNRNLTISNTGSGILGLTATTALALTVGQHMEVSGGTVTLVTGANSNTVSLAVTGNLLVSGSGTFNVCGTGATGVASTTVSVGGVVTNSSSATSALSITNSAKIASITATGLFTQSGSGSSDLGNGTGTATFTANGGVTVSGGTLRVSDGGPGVLTVATSTTLTVNGGTLIGSATAHTSTINANGTTLVSSGTLTLANLASANSTMNVADNQTITVNGTGTLNVAVLGTGTLNVATNVASASATSGYLEVAGTGTINVASGGTGTINMYCDLELTAGTFAQTAGTAAVNFVGRGTGLITPHPQVLSQGTCIPSGTMTWTVGGGTITNPTLLILGSSLDIGSSTTMNMTSYSYLDFGSTYLLSGNVFNQVYHSNLITANTDGFYSSGAQGSIRTTTRGYSTTGNFIFNGTGAQNTGNAVTQALYLTIYNNNGVNLTASCTINFVAGPLPGGVVLFSDPTLRGDVILGNSNLTLSTGTTITGASSSDHIRTTGTGVLTLPVSTSAVTFPVGNSAYNPIILTPSVGTNIPYQVRVIDAVTSPSANDPTKLINRYWSITAPTAAANTLTMNGQWNTGEQNANYNAGSQVKVGYHNGSIWATLNSTQSGSNPFTSSGGFALSATHINAGITFGIGKDDGFLSPTTTYIWTGTDDNTWADPDNWNPNTSVAGPTVTDNIIINIPGANVLTITGTESVSDFDLSGTGTFNMAASSSITINGNFTYSSSGVPSFNCSSTWNLFGTGPQPIPAFNYGNLNATGGDRTLANSGIIGICGSFTRGAGAYTIAGSTVNYFGSGAQTIAIGTYNNLTISNARGSANLTSPAGTISVAGNFDVSTLSAYTPVVNAASIFDFTSAGAQTIPAFFYGQLNNSGNGARTLASSGIVDISQGFTPTTGTTTVTGSSVRYSNTDAVIWSLTSFTSNIPGRQYNNLEFTGSASTVWVPAASFNPGVAGTLTISGPGTLRISNSTTSNTLTVDGNTTISNGVLQVVGPSASAGITGTFVTNDLTISGTGQLNLDAASNSAAGVVTINGATLVTSTTAAAINLGSGTANANNIFNVKGNFTKSGTGTLGLTGTYNATAIYNFNGASPQTWNHSGAAMTGGGIAVASGSTLQLATNLVAASSSNPNPINIAGELDCQGFTVSAGNAANTFSLNATGTIRTSSSSGIAGAVSGFTPAPAFASGGTFIFTGTNVNAGFSGFSGIIIGNQYTITWLGSTSLTLDKSMNLNAFNFTNNGLVYLGNFSISIPSSAGGLTGSGFGVGKMFVTNGSGTLSRAVIITPVAQGLPFTWPIGENNGTLEYSPVTINSIASQGINGSIAFRVVDDVHPDLALATSYLTRYWPCTVTGFNASFTLGTSTFTYDSGTDVVVGPEASLRGNSYNGTTTDWTQYSSSSAGLNVLTITSGLGGASMPTAGPGTYDITARVDVPVYYRTVSGGSWSAPGIWEISSSPTFASTFTPVNPPTTANSDSVLIQNLHTVNVNSTASADEVFVKTGGVLNITTGGSFTLPNGPGAVDMRVDGQLLVATPFTISASARLFVTNLVRQTVTAQITTTGTLQIGATGTYEHATASGASLIPTATWDAGSTCLLKYSGTTLPTGLGQAFHHFTLDADPGSSGAAGNLNNIAGNLTLISTGSNDFRLGAGTNYTINVGGNVDVQGLSSLDVQTGGGTSVINISGNLLQASGSLITRSGSGIFTWNVTGDFIQSGGTFQLNVPSSTGNFNLRGNLTNNGAISAPSGTRNWNFVKSTGVQTITQTTGTMANAFNWSVGDGTTTTNTLQFLSNVNLGGSGSPLNFTVKSGSTVDFGTFVLSASNGTSAFLMQNNTSLITANTAGITSSGATGSVQMGTRTYTGGSNNNNFTYNSTTANQATGNGLPTTMNSLTINNTGGAGNNTVSMTSNNHVITTLNLSNGLLAIGSGNTTIIASGGTVNATSGNFATGSTGGMVRFSTPAGGSFTGTCSPFSVETNGNPCGINFGTGTVTIQSGGVFNINAGGFVNTNAPAYAAGSSLWYLTGGVYGRGLEWSSTSGKGYPHHVVVGTSTLNPASAGAVNANVPFQCAGNLTINSGGNIYMDYSGNNMIEDLRVLGNLNLVGQLSGSGTSGSDIFVGGNWTNNGVATTNFFPNGRQVDFNGSTAQTIGGSNTTVPAFDYLAISNSGANVTTNVSLTANIRLQMNSGKLIIGNNNITIGASGIIDQGGVNSYIVTNGTGFVSQTVNGGNDWFPVGPSVSAFGPVTLNQSGTGETINVRVINVAGIALPSYQNAVNDTTQMVKLEWVMNESVAGANSLRTTFGWQEAGTAGSSNIEGSAFDRTSAVYHGNWNGTKYVVRASNATSGTNPYFSLSTVAQPFTGTMAANQRFVIGNINGILPCNFTLNNGLWSNPSNWNDGLPVAGQALCINHAMQISANPADPLIVTVNSPNGNIVIDPGVTLTFEPGGTFTNNNAGFNMTSGTVKFQTGTSTINGSQAMGLYNLELNGNTTFTTVPTINNQMEIKAGGFVISSNGPNYGASSTLIYNTGGNYNRSNEWRATANPGYPANVLVTGNTDLNLDAGTGVNRNIQGNLQVDNGSSISQGSTTFALTVPGNFTLNGAYTQSTNIGGDMLLGGNWNSGAAASLSSNNRDVRFNGSAAQTISTANALNFGLLTIDNAADAVSLLSNIRAYTFRVNASRTFDLTSSNKISILANGNVLINGTFNANNGTIEYLDGGNFTNNGTFNRGTSTIDFLPNASFTGFVSGSVQTNFHNIYLGSFSGVDFNSGPLRGRVSGVFQLRNGSFVSGNAPIYEANSKLMYSGGGTFNRNVEWDPATVQKVEVRNNTTLKCGTNGTAFSHTMADSLIIQSGSTFDMTGPNMTAPTVVGGTVLLLGTMNLSNAGGGDLELGGNFVNNGGSFNCNSRLTTFNGSANASILGSTNTNFCLLTVNKPSGSSLTAGVAFTSSLAGGTIVRVQGGTFDLNGQALTLGGGTNVLRVDAGFASGQTLKTGGTNIGGFNTYTDNGVTTATLGGKVDYSGAGAETLISSATTYNMLWITGGAIKSINQTTTANGDVNIDPGTSLDFGATASVLNAKADIVNQGSTIGTGLGKIELNGAGVQNMSGSGTYRNLDINNNNNVNSSGIPTISSKLNVLQGKVLQASLNDSIILGSSATLTETFINPANQHFVRGKVHTTRVVGVAAENFGGLGVALTAGSNLGTVEVTRLSGVALTSPITLNSGIVRSWKVTPSVQPALPNRNITFSWPSQDNNSLDMTTAILFKRVDGTQPFVAVTAPTDVTGSDPHSITYSGIPSFSEFTVADLNNPLPLNLLHFSGKNEGGSAILTWSTSDERSNIGFEIMKSTDGVSFSKIGFVASQGTSGDYRFTDNFLRVNSYYKLIQLDESGQTTSSRIVYISTKFGETISLNLYPNPGQKGFNIQYNGFENGDEFLNLEVINLEGKTIRSLAGTLSEINALISKDLVQVSSGVYLVKLQIGNEQHRLKWVKQ